MRLNDLSTYGREKYGLKVKKGPDELPSSYELCMPKTDKCIAFMNAEWNYERGELEKFCDIRCGREFINRYSFVREPFYRKGSAWAGIIINENTTPEFVYMLLDEAVRKENNEKFTIVLNHASNIEGYAATPVNGRVRDAVKGVPDRIIKMMQLYQYGNGTMQDKCRNFYIQGKFMEDYEDNVPWTDSYQRYFTTYHDLNITQLRGYFTWRKYVRRGIYKSVSTSLAYMYVYELLCGIGTSSCEDTLAKLEAFEKGFLDSGTGDPKMRTNLHRWEFEYVIMHQMDRQTALRYEIPSVRKRDENICILKNPDQYDDKAVCDALFFFRRKKPENALVMKADGRGMHLYALTWKAGGPALFERCFSTQKEYVFMPLGNTVYYSEKKTDDSEYILNDARKYVCHNGIWKMWSYESLYFDDKKIDEFLHGTESYLRKALKAGHPLKRKEDEDWVEPLVKKALEKLREEEKPKVVIDYNGLNRIRADAAVTRDSLLTEEEMEPDEEEEIKPVKNSFLDKDNMEIMKKLLNGESVKAYLHEHHLMSSVAADALNEIFFDEIGDNVIEDRNGDLSLVEDYRQDVLDVLKGGGDE